MSEDSGKKASSAAAEEAARMGRSLGKKPSSYHVKISAREKGPYILHPPRQIAITDNLETICKQFNSMTLCKSVLPQEVVSAVERVACNATGQEAGSTCTSFLGSRYNHWSSAAWSGRWWWEGTEGGGLLLPQSIPPLLPPSGCDSDRENKSAAAAVTGGSLPRSVWRRGAMPRVPSTSTAREPADIDASSNCRPSGRGTSAADPLRKDRST